jgi:mRNA interferase RelE/StbE
VVYQISIEPAAMRELKKLAPRIRQALSDAITALGTEPRPDGVRKLSGSKNSYRIRVSEYRVLYRVTDGELLVLVVKVGHRKDVYK